MAPNKKPKPVKRPQTTDPPPTKKKQKTKETTALVQCIQKDPSTPPHKIERLSEKQVKGTLLRARQHKVLTLHAQGKTTEQIATMMGMKPNHVTVDIDRGIDRLIRHYASPPQHTFVRYAAFQFNIIQKLQDLVDKFRSDPQTTQYNAAVSALRAQSEAYDKVLDRGLSFGVIPKKQASEAIRKEPKDLRMELRTEIDTLTKLLDAVDDATQARAIRVGSDNVSYAVIVKKPLRNAYGIVRAVPDWKYRKLVTHVTDSGCRAKLKSEITDEDRETLPEFLQEGKIKFNEELRRLSTELEVEEQTHSEAYSSHRLPQKNNDPTVHPKQLPLPNIADNPTVTKPPFNYLINPK